MRSLSDGCILLLLALLCEFVVVDELDGLSRRPAKATGQTASRLASLFGADNAANVGNVLRGVDIPAREGLAAADTNPPAVAEDSIDPPQSIGNGATLACGVAVNVQGREGVHEVGPHFNVADAVEVPEDMKANGEPARIQGGKGSNLAPDLGFQFRPVLETMGKGHAVPVAFAPPFTGRRARCALFKGEGEKGEASPHPLHDDGQTLAQLAIAGRGLEHLNTGHDRLAGLRVDRATEQSRMRRGELHAKILAASRPRNKPTRKESRWKTIVTVRLGVCILDFLVEVTEELVLFRFGHAGHQELAVHGRQHREGVLDQHPALPSGIRCGELRLRHGEVHRVLGKGERAHAGDRNHARDYRSGFQRVKRESKKVCE